MQIRFLKIDCVRQRILEVSAVSPSVGEEFACVCARPPRFNQVPVDLVEKLCAPPPPQCIENSGC